MEFLILKFQILATIFMSLEYFLDKNQKTWLDSLTKRLLIFFDEALNSYMSFLSKNLKKSINNFLKSLPFLLLYTLGIISIIFLLFQPFSIMFIQEYHSKGYWLYITLVLWIVIGFFLKKIADHSIGIVDIFLYIFIMIIPVILKTIIRFLLFVKKGPLAAIGLVFLIISFYFRYQNL